MNRAIRIGNLPGILPDHIFEEILQSHEVRYIQWRLEEPPESGGLRVGYVLLDEHVSLEKDLDELSECEVADEILSIEEAPEEIRSQMIHLHEEKRKRVLRAKGIYPEEDKITPKSLGDPALLQVPFTSLTKNETIQANLEKAGIRIPTPIQALSIPYALEGRDIIGRAQTGTGKTLAFSIPILEKILTQPKRGIRALILTPTRELAIQTEQVFRQLAEGAGIRTFVMYGGEHILDQMVKLREGVDILVATPGRLLDLMGRGRVRYDMAEFFVLDEADRMMDMGFMPDVNDIHSCFYEHPQTLLFTATTPREFVREATRFMKDPVFVDVGAPDLTPLDAVEQEIIHLREEDKMTRLCQILDRENGPTLIFCCTKKDTENLASRLASDGYPVKRIHGDIEQEDRTKAVQAFRSGAIRILVATDVAARGLDIEGVAHVINYDLPQEPEDHLHRIGRTARAGASGKATTFVTKRDERLLKDFEVVFGKKFE